MKETDDGKMLFVPDQVEAKRGEQVRFVLKNDGKVDHEFMLDTRRAEREAQDRDAEEPRHGARRPEREAAGAGWHERDRLALQQGWHLRIRLSDSRPLRIRDARQGDREGRRAVARENKNDEAL